MTVRSLLYRRVLPADIKFVQESWLASYRTSHAAGMIAMEDWHDVMVVQVHKVLARPHVEIAVACHPHETTADLYGWAAAEKAPGEPPLVHYCYVKQHYRRMGIARGLLLWLSIPFRERFFYTCKTPVVSKLPIAQARWMPLIARYKPGQRGSDERNSEDT